MPTSVSLGNRIVAHAARNDQVPPAFYTGWGDDPWERAEALIWMEEWFQFNKPNTYWYWYETCVDQRWFDAQVNWIDENYEDFEYMVARVRNPVNVFSYCLSQAMATVSTATDAFLFMPSGQTPRDNSVWLATELPALTKNPHVNKIYRIDPRPQHPRDNPGGACQTLIWDRATDAQVDFGWQCPV